MTRRRIGAIESLARTDWPWMVFDHTGKIGARGSDRASAINRFERAEGRYSHGAYAVCRNSSTGEEWRRRRGSWDRA